MPKMKPTEKTKKNSSKVSSRLYLGERVPKLRFPGFEGEWEAKKFGSLICETNNRTTKENEDILLSAAIEGMFLNSELFDHQRGISNKGYKKISRNTLILSTQNLHLGNANVNLRFEHGIVSPAYKTYDIIGCNHYLLSHWIKSEKAKKFFYDATTVGASLCRRNVEWETLYEQTLALPNLDEQNQLAKFLNLLIARISAQRKLVELLKKHKRGVQSAIFEGYLRVPCQGREHLAKWETIKIGNIFNERSERGGNADELLSVTINFGVRRQSDTEKKDSSSEDKGNYKRVVAGDIVYNTMRMWQGASGVSPWAGIVSPAYTVIYPKRNQNTIFWAYAFKHWRLVQTFQKFSQGLTSDTWNLKFPQLADIKVAMPSLDEQNVIVEFLSRLDARIDVAERELVNLSALKSGLLQQLFV